MEEAKKQFRMMEQRSYELKAVADMREASERVSAHDSTDKRARAS